MRYLISLVLVFFIVNSCFKNVNAQYYFSMFGHQHEVDFPDFTGLDDKDRMKALNDLAFYHSFSSPTLQYIMQMR